MRIIAVYWVIGCLLLGIGEMKRAQRCPDDRVSAQQVLLFVATWPAVIGALVSGIPPTPSACDERR